MVNWYLGLKNYILKVSKKVLNWNMSILISKSKIKDIHTNEALKLRILTKNVLDFIII